MALKSILFVLVVKLSLFGWAGVCYGGLLLAPAVKWKTFSIAPEEDEPTPNYYSYGVGLTAGYSFSQVFDIATFGAYLPSKLDAASVGKESVQFFEYGGELALRFSQAVYLAVRGGRFYYRMLYTHDKPNQVKGLWRGPAGSVSLGTIIKDTRITFWQVSFDIGSGTILREDAISETDYRIDSFGITVSFVINTYNKFGSSLMGSFKDSFNF